MIETFIIVIVVTVLAALFFRWGKHLGSRKGYNVGLHRGRGRRRR